MRKFILGLVLTLFAGFAGFQSTQSVRAADKPSYTIATDATYAPFDFQADNGEYRGIDLDLLKEISKSQGFTYTLKPMSFNAAVQALDAKQVDGVIAGMSITPERKAKFDFSDPYYDSGEVMAVGKNSKITSPKDLKGKTVALKTGTVAAEYGKSLQKKYGFKVKYFNDSNTMYNDVINGNSAACFEDYPVMAYGIKNGMDLKIVTKPVGGGQYGFAVNKGMNKALITSFNKGLKQARKDGTYKKVVDRYLSTKKTKLTADSKSSRTVWGLLKTNKAAFLSGFWMTIKLTVISIIFATILGICLGVMGVVPSRILRGVSSTIIYVFRGMPLMVLAFFIYIGIPNLTGDKIPAIVAGIIALTLNEGAYTGAFVKGGFKAVDKGQMEAARSLGLPYGKSMLRVIMPQGLRIMIPSFVNQFIITLKDTSILSVIGLFELTQTGTIIISRNMEGFKVWTIIALIYIVVITLLTWLSNWAERRTRI
ncbi:glutamine ABC transporter substrate-binding protein [Secundilactobacillus oryzae JCM 18671]|uniref:Glutamine ABC transporter substrate-binding protein n=1 Tax=Secundilactobacillus oryzae JCM 18671 TaxID=1291743 RepID=A0A081BKC9_9LACO|nr:amino acid ABC transporter substrate-binding protein/permease [Secundilactobacillus oryzae]GAK48497.1 glutamine ABC transporter substrate-binding protein [Secundilactobacillus oryzae JCM 18671]